MTDLTVANTILEQLGGNRFSIITGAKNFSGDENSLSFSVPRTKGKYGSVNYVKVVLNSMDTYDVYYRYIHGMNTTDVAVSAGIYNYMLKESFETNTGLYTSF